MEIADYLRVARRRLWVLLGVPILAAAVTAYIVMAAPTTYSGTSTVSAPALVGGSTSNQYSGSQAVNQFVAQFTATAHVPAVLDAVSKDTNVPRTDLTDNVTVSQVGASSVMQLGYTSTDKKTVQPVLQSLSKHTLQTLFTTQVALSQGQLSSAQAALAQSNAAIVAWEKTNSMVDPNLVYQTTLQRLNSLTQQWATLQANGAVTGAAAINGAIASLKAELPRFGPLLAQYQVLASNRDASAAAVTSAQQNLAQSRAQLEAADPAKVADISATTADSKTSALLSLVLPVTGAAVFLAIALVAMLELLSRSRVTSATSRPEQDSAGQDLAWTRQEPREPVGAREPAGSLPGVGG
jgi:capsular polysaccharide biosynthesis protein